MQKRLSHHSLARGRALRAAWLYELSL